MNDRMMKFQIVMMIISIIYVFLEYYGYWRYMQLRYRTCEGYAKNYLKSPRAESKGKLIVSMGTRIDNFDLLKATMNSILDQTVHPDQIILSLPKSSSLIIPSLFKNDKILIVHQLSTDYGNLNALLSPLLREKDGDAKIILVTDNQIYGTDLIETLVDASEKTPNSVIFTKGYNARQTTLKGYKVDVPYTNDVIDVTGGVLIKPKFFGPDVFEFDDHQSQNIDNFLSTYLHQKHVVFTQIKYEENFRKFTEISSDGRSTLSYYAALYPSFN